jgi:hypothetical protein
VPPVESLPFSGQLLPVCRTPSGAVAGHDQPGLTGGV